MSFLINLAMNKVGGTQGPKGLPYNNKGLHSNSSPWPPHQCHSGCSRPHPLPGGFNMVAVSTLGSGCACPRLSSPSVHSAVARRHHNASRVRKSSSRACGPYTYGRFRLYWVRCTSWSMVTPSPCCTVCWPHSATPGRALLGP